MAENFDRPSLSQRENEILDLAIEGLTDQQIALRLTISPSTVNSYWVRIRGKLGQLSRTELVAQALREKARLDLLQLQAQSDHFEALASRRQMQEENFARSDTYKAVLDSFPEAVLAIGEDGKILFVNEMLTNQFGYRPEELLDGPFERLLATRDREAYRARMAQYFRAPYPIRLGVNTVIYGRRKDGHAFRVVLSLNGCRTSTGHITTCIVRNLVEEIDLVRRQASAVVEDLLRPITSEEAALRTELR